MAEKQNPKQNYKHVIRVVRTDLDGAKPIKYALLKIKGVGVNFSHMLCNLCQISTAKKAGALSDDEVKKLEAGINDPLGMGAPEWMLNRQKDPHDGAVKHLTTGDLEFANQNDIKTLKKIKCYRGIRHIQRLPVRGQKTRSNFRKNKGKVHLGVKRKK